MANPSQFLQQTRAEIAKVRVGRRAARWLVTTGMVVLCFAVVFAIFFSSSTG